ncbi:MAG: putative hemolysin [Pseudohongiellaceae bacterium]|jgi:putative hemolysin
MHESAKPQLFSPALADVPELCFSEGRYQIRLATTQADVRAALRLRYQVFNLELGEGLASSKLTGEDKDAFDDSCHHLIVEHAGQVVGTYRMQTYESARSHQGYYSDGEYHLDDLGQGLLKNSVEIGRACVAKEHRKQKVLFGLWRGLGRYLQLQGKRYLFGCCSLTSQDTAEGREVMAWLRQQNLVWPGPIARARPSNSCFGPAPEATAVAAVKLPTLFGTYMRFGVRVASDPAIDREFKTIDFLVVMDTDSIPALVRRMFFTN